VRAAGAVATDTIVEHGGSVVVWGGVTSRSQIHASGSTLRIAYYFGTPLATGEGEFISSGGIGIDDTVYSGGIELVRSGAASHDATVSSGGKLVVSNGGIATGADIFDGGLEIVRSGGRTSDVAIGFGGLFVVSSGGTASLAGIAAGGRAITSGATLELEPGGAVNGSIAFAPGAVGTLKIDGTVMQAGTISGFVASDTIDLVNVAFVSGSSSRATLASNNELRVSMGGHSYLLELNPFQDFTGSSFQLFSDGSGGTIIKIGSSLFTPGADVVNFNSLLPSQMAAIAAGADIYNGLGANDVVTLPNVANYKESVGGGKTLGWANGASQPFSTDSRPGDVYAVSGGNGSYFINAGSGTDKIAISGGGTSYVSAGTGIFDITVGGGGRIVLESDNGNVGSGSATIAAKSVVEVKEKSLGTVKFSSIR
jgi:autotransporter passenger strand-loop-strand repeat protein